MGALAPEGAVSVTLRDAGPEARSIDVRGPRATVARLAEAACASIEGTT
jgi:hypothetical protein